MRQNIPPEDLARIEEFNREEAARAAGRPPKLKDKDRKLEELLEGKLPRSTTQEIEQFATRLDISIERGGGKHGKHLVATDENGQEHHCSLPDPVKGTGTLESIVDFLRTYGKFPRQD